ncbi:TetR/AcrR family transcriptional regulator [Pectobacterium zantedeschiae]|uniref:TetR/AcrR family transcriptional regulator n=1 Tax=Pectobacterium zantedeschiae TaxID=2034769 RepID=A0A9X8P5Y6_9GAMM|nr:TetR/AcrR family transcriptional regulator [Pectobacterium zantedeschiae]RYC38278.1 TetR family transcriptional regulator [Pectobacterium zantedeschiae]RYC44923.1 TetR/AcrR family transcriptional regulator [Pectobacterium zantedeschiae]
MHAVMGKEERIQRRRDQIIAAARICFRRGGFHGGGMAEIAKHAELSVGQIYRYFANKDAIIEEIVRRITNDKLQFMEFGVDHDSHIRHAALAFSQRGKMDAGSVREDDRALMLEVTAEATRNARIAAILQDADNRLFQQACTMMARHYPQFTHAQIAARVEMMATLTEGTAFRSVVQSPATDDTLNPLYLTLLNHLFSMPEHHE